MARGRSSSLLPPDEPTGGALPRILRRRSGRRRFRRPRLSRRAPSLSRRRCAPPRPPRADRRSETGLQLLATNDVLYHAPERRPLQDVLTCIREHCTIAEAGFRLAANAERHLKPAARDGAAVPRPRRRAGAQPRDRRALPLSASTNCATNTPRSRCRRRHDAATAPRRTGLGRRRRAVWLPLLGDASFETAAAQRSSVRRKICDGIKNSASS